MAINSQILQLAQDMVSLIGEWRAEISEKKDLSPKINSEALAKFLEEAEKNGISLNLSIYTILACEWLFRIRKMTEEDMERELYNMEAGLCKPDNGVFTQFQAQIFIKAFESELKKQMKDYRIPLSLKVPISTPIHPKWDAFDFNPNKKEKRLTPKRVIPKRRGRIPVIGPIMAAITFDALLEGKRKLRKGVQGDDLCEILLERKVLLHEYNRWKSKIADIQLDLNPPLSLRLWMALSIEKDHRIYFEEQKKSLLDFLVTCKKRYSPTYQSTEADFIEKQYQPQLFERMAKRDLFNIVFSIEWGT